MWPANIFSFHVMASSASSYCHSVKKEGGGRESGGREEEDREGKRGERECVCVCVCVCVC